MNRRWWTWGALIGYLLFAVVEGLFGAIGQLTWSGPVASAAESQSVILRTRQNLTPRATYQMPGFDTIVLRYTLSQEIESSQVTSDCEGKVEVRNIHVDKGIEYEVTFVPAEYCDVVRFFIGDTQISQIVWQKWGSILSIFLDMPDSMVKDRMRSIKKDIIRGELSEHDAKYFATIYATLQDILESRKNPNYLIPVPGSNIPTTTSYLPNAGRPYREAYTDGIHHGWDFYGPFGSDIVSLDDGVIVYVKRDFSWSEFERIDLEGDVNGIYEHTNLDILRGNQVWIKTMTGDIVFYSHFNDVEPGLREGDIIKRGVKLGTIGTTGVPFRDYDRYHLHIPLMMNPRAPEKVGKYSRLDIMHWDWYGKHNSLTWILENQEKLFSAF